MTLVIGAVAHGMVVIVADRLVSLQRGRRLEALDRSATKLLAYVARDAHVAIGYAGQAFIKGMPVDEVIAEVLAGQKFNRGRDQFCGVGLGGERPPYDIGLAIKRVMDVLVAGILPKQVIQLLVMGHQHNRHGLVRPLAMRIELTSSGMATARRLERNFPMGRGLIDSIGLPLSAEETPRIAEDVFHNPSVTTLNHIAENLTAAIRRNSVPGVGSHTTAILLPPPTHAPIETAFFPLEPHLGLLRTPYGELAFEADLCPWIIAPGTVKPPTAEMGDGEYADSAGRLLFVTRGAKPQTQPDGGILTAMSTTPRFELPENVLS